MDRTRVLVLVTTMAAALAIAAGLRPARHDGDGRRGRARCLPVDLQHLRVLLNLCADAVHRNVADGFGTGSRGGDCLEVVGP